MSRKKHTKNPMEYKYFGLEGLGISYLVGYLILALHVLIIVYFKFNFVLQKKFVILFFISFMLVAVCFISKYYFSGIIQYLIGCATILIASMYSLHQLNERINIFEFVRSKIKR